jgi:hypothetical protein
MLTNVNSYKPFVDCFELKVVFSSYREYICDCKERRLISDLKLFKYYVGTTFWKAIPHTTIDIGGFIGEN